MRVFLILLGSSLVLWAGECVPGGRPARAAVVSPDGRYRLLDLLCSNPSEAQRGALVLAETKSGTRRTIYNYNRDAGALWSPDSRHIAVNDYAGSNVTLNVVLSVSGQAPPIDLNERVLDSIPGRRIPRTDHLYMSVIGWRSNDEMELIAFGHISELDKPADGFCLGFSVTLEGKVQPRGLPDTGPDPEGYCWKLAR